MYFYLKKKIHRRTERPNVQLAKKSKAKHAFIYNGILKLEKFTKN